MRDTQDRLILQLNDKGNDDDGTGNLEIPVYIVSMDSTKRPALQLLDLQYAPMADTGRSYAASPDSARSVSGE